MGRGELFTKYGIIDLEKFLETLAQRNSCINLRLQCRHER